MTRYYRCALYDYGYSFYECYVFRRTRRQNADSKYGKTVFYRHCAVTGGGGKQTNGDVKRPTPTAKINNPFTRENVYITRDSKRHPKSIFSRDGR